MYAFKSKWIWTTEDTESTEKGNFKFLPSVPLWSEALCDLCGSNALFLVFCFLSFSIPNILSVNYQQWSIILLGSRH